MGNTVKKSEKILTYKKRKLEVMSGQEQKQDNDENTIDINKIKKTVLDFINHNAVASILVVLILYIFHDLPSDVASLKTNMAVNNSQIEVLMGNYTILNSQVWSKNIEESNVNKANGNIEDENLPIDVILASNTFSQEIAKVSSSGENSGWINYIKKDESIGTKVDSQDEVPKSSMENRPFILKYEENGEDVIFYGQYNEYGHWNGDCIINRYKNSKLTFIMEANYDDGELKTYSQVFRGKNFKDQEIWYVSDRYVKGKENSGVTRTYFFYGDYEKKLDVATITENDIIDVDRFCETIPSTIEGYYNGYTSDGKYNDNSGKAYFVKYKPNGNVRYLYVGKIKNGEEDDDTGNAWSIAWGDADDGYHYYKGKFSNGERSETPDKDWTKPMSQEKIDSIVDPDKFNCSLQGLVE